MLWQLPVREIDFVGCIATDFRSQIIAMFLIVAIGLDQSKVTARWRLLLMSEKEEIAWSQKRFQDILEAEGPLVLPEDDERVQVLKRVCDKLVQAMDAEDMVCSAIWPHDGKFPFIRLPGRRTLKV